METLKVTNTSCRPPTLFIVELNRSKWMYKYGGKILQDKEDGHGSLSSMEGSPISGSPGDQSPIHPAIQVSSIFPSSILPPKRIHSFFPPSSPSMLFKTSSPCLLRFPLGKKEVPPKAATHIFPALLSLSEPCFRTVRRSERKKEAEEIKIRPCRIFRTGILWRPVSIQKKTTSHLIQQLCIKVWQQTFLLFDNSNGTLDSKVLSAVFLVKTFNLLVRKISEHIRCYWKGRLFLWTLPGLLILNKTSWLIQTNRLLF